MNFFAPVEAFSSPIKKFSQHANRLGLWAAVISIFTASLLISNCLQAETITCNRASGYIDKPFDLALSTTNPNLTIHFTTNGDIPRPSKTSVYPGSLHITTTTIIRAVAFHGDHPVTPVLNRTFLSVPAIPGQSGGDFPKVWGTNGMQTLPAHYSMATTAVAELRESLRSLPTISITARPDDLFSAEAGIYLHPAERGAAWERPASVELFNTSDGNGFQVDCGLRIHGGRSRQPEESPKHSFRLSFKQLHGQPTLRFALFGPAGPAEFRELILRAGNSDSCLDSNGRHRLTATYIRDEWMRQSMQAMGHPASHGSFVHLYLNGLYWGIYNLCESPNPEKKPGAAGDFDVRKGDQLEAGNESAWAKLIDLIDGDVTDTNSYIKINQLIDLAEFADYMILNLFAGNQDWDSSANWYAIRPRQPGGRFQFLVWDAEQILHEPQTGIPTYDDPASPFQIFRKLSQNNSFRELVASRTQRLFQPGGVLSPDIATKRFLTLADTVHQALIAESARWGGYRKDLHPYKSGPFETYNFKEHWQPEIKRIQNQFFTQRPDVLFKQLQDLGVIDR